MSYYLKAVEQDIDQKYIQAIEMYELSIKNNENYVDSFINLSFLYWNSSAEFAWADAYQIPTNIRSIGAEKSMEILDTAIGLFPDCAELYFWVKYFPHRLYFSPFESAEIISIIEQHTDCNLVPYFALYIDDKLKYRKQRLQLLEKCKQSPIRKNVYIKSIIEN